jgi:hypothetical protein
MPPDDLIVSIGDLDPDALAILRDLLSKGDLHFEHKPLAADPGFRAPTWVQEAVRHLHKVQDGTFPQWAKLPAPWLEAHYPRPMVPVAWDEVHSMCLRALVSMLSDQTYKKGSKFFPETVQDWFLATPNRKPRWSCFLRYAGLPDVRGSLSSDLQGTCFDPVSDAPTLKIQRIRNSMSPEAVEAVEKALSKPGAKSYGAVGWERAGRLYGWWQGSERYRDQFGEQLDRVEGMRHSVRWRKALGSFPGLVRLCVLWPDQGTWGGWFPIPGEPTWEVFCDWVAREQGLWLMEPGDVGPFSHEEPAAREWEQVFQIP